MYALPLAGCGDSSESSCGEDDSSEDHWESGSKASDGSLYLPTPERRLVGRVSPSDLLHAVGFIALPQFEGL